MRGSFSIRSRKQVDGLGSSLFDFISRNLVGSWNRGDRNLGFDPDILFFEELRSNRFTGLPNRFYRHASLRCRCTIRRADDAIGATVTLSSSGI